MKARSEGIAQAKALMRQSRYDQAAGLLANLLNRFPGDAEATALLKTVRGKRPRSGTIEPTPQLTPVWKKPAVMGAIGAVLLIAIAAIAKSVFFPGAPPLAVSADCAAAGQVGESYSCTLKATGGTGAYRWTLANKALPPGLVLDGSAGTIGGTPTGDGSFDFTVRVSDERGHTADSNAMTLAIAPRKKEIVTSSTGTGTGTVTPPPPVQVDTQLLPEGKVGDNYSVTLDASGGTPPYAWTVSRLPAVLSLRGAVIGGKPTAEGNTEVQVRVGDKAKQTAQRSLSISIKSVAAPVPPPRILTTALPEGKVGERYSGRLSGTGGKPQYRWQLVGSLPGGLQLDGNSGQITGTPVAESRANVAVRLTDSEGRTADGSVPLVIHAPAPPPGPRCPASTVSPIKQEDYAANWRASSNGAAWPGSR